MTDFQLLTAMRELLFYAVVAVCLVTTPTLIVGLLVSIFQAATQINEVTLTFVPKMIVMFGVISFYGPWLIQNLITITQHYYSNFSHYIG